MANILETVTGKQIDLLNIKPDDMDIRDIAWALSRIPRFCGHSLSAIPYNVAQHSIFVYNKVVSWVTDEKHDPQLVLPESFAEARREWGEVDRYRLYKLALLHDAAEFLTNDIPSPVKHLPGVYSAIKNVENAIDAAIIEKFCLNLTEEKHKMANEMIHFADLYSRKIESYTFIHSRGLTWENLPEVSLQELQLFEAPMSSLESYELFMETFNTVRG